MPNSGNVESLLGGCQGAESSQPAPFPRRSFARPGACKSRPQSYISAAVLGELIAAGCDVVTVQRAMGHASATTTLRTSARLWPTDEDNTSAAASGMAATALATSLPHMKPPYAADLLEHAESVVVGEVSPMNGRR
jgi:hypothetical protein